MHEGQPISTGAQPYRTVSVTTGGRGRANDENNMLRPSGRASVHTQTLAIVMKNYAVQKKQRYGNLCRLCWLLGFLMAAVLVSSLSTISGWAESKNLLVVDHKDTNLMVPRALAGVSGPIFRTLFAATWRWPSGFTAHDAAQIANVGVVGWAMATSTTTTTTTYTLSLPAWLAGGNQRGGNQVDQIDAAKAR